MPLSSVQVSVAPAECRCLQTAVVPRLGAAPAAQALLDATWRQLLEPEPCSVSFLDFVVESNARGLLSVTFRAVQGEGSPTVRLSPLTLVTSTGQQLRARDAFGEEAMAELVRLWDERLQQALRSAPTVVEDCGLTERFDEPVHFAEEHLDPLIVTPEGLLVHFDFGVPAARAELTPPSELRLPFTAVQSLVRADGPLSWIRDLPER